MVCRTLDNAGSRARTVAAGAVVIEIQQDQWRVVGPAHIPEVDIGAVAVSSVSTGSSLVELLVAIVDSEVSVDTRERYPAVPG